MRGGIISNKNVVNITNIGGTKGHAEVDDGMTVNLVPPKIENPSDQLSPKHFVGLAWGACLNATIASVLSHDDDADNESKVRVEVESRRTKEEGLHYIVTAYVTIEGYDENNTLRIANTAHRLCPVSKLIEKNQHVFVKAEGY